MQAPVMEGSLVIWVGMFTREQYGSKNLFGKCTYNNAHFSVSIYWCWDPRCLPVLLGNHSFLVVAQVAHLCSVFDALFYSHPGPYGVSVLLGLIHGHYQEISVCSLFSL